MKQQFLLSIVTLLLSTYSHAAVWNVGPTRTYTLPSQVKALVSDDDTIYIDGGIYANDATKWTHNNLKIIGLGTGNNRSILQYTGDIPNGKGIFVFETPGGSDNAYLENLVFDGAQVSDGDGGNGSGVRYQSNNLTVNNCRFVNCQNGILEGNASVTASNVTIINSEFENNGYQMANANLSGYEHNIYISAGTDTLVVMNCYFHHPRGQANSLKTRAQCSYILYNLIDEEATGFGSYEINIAQGGLNIIVGNVIIQGPAGANHSIVGYDAITNTLEDFYFINNTVINQFVGNVKYFSIAPSAGITTFKVYNNIFASVPGASVAMFSTNTPSVFDSSANLFSMDYLSLGFTNAAANDFSLTSAVTGAIDKGTNAGSTGTGFALLPASMYQSFTSPLLPRVISGAAIDIGAYEFAQPSGISENNSLNGVSIYPNPSSGKFHISTGGKIDVVEVFDLNGRKVLGFLDGGCDFDLTGYAKGVYFVKMVAREGIFNKKIILTQ